MGLYLCLVSPTLPRIASLLWAGNLDVTRRNLPMSKQTHLMYCLQMLSLRYSKIYKNEYIVSQNVIPRVIQHTCS
jgi:hypothetical protein